MLNDMNDILLGGALIVWTGAGIFSIMEKFVMLSLMARRERETLLLKKQLEDAMKQGLLREVGGKLH